MKGEINMKEMEKILDTLKGVTGIQSEYILLFIVSIIALVIVKLIAKVISHIYKSGRHSGRDVFKFNQRLNLLANIILIFIIFIIWEDYLDNVVTIISFISAGATIALREVILNLFAGIYIKVAKPFVVEDRIEVGDIKGDVVLITAISFKVLELGDRVNGEQSNGIIVNIPNSQVFSSSLKNYTTAFKYIWSEMKVNVDLEADVNLHKKKLYEIVNNNAVIKSIPKKMDKAIDAASGDYRIYYNNLKPIIYTEYVDNHIEFTVRFLVHPKKERNVLDELWISIIKSAQKGEIKLYKKA